MKPRWVLAALGFISLLSTAGCATAALTLLGVGAGTAAGQGISHTVNSVAYKTFTMPIDDVERATLTSLERMEVIVVSREEDEAGGRMIEARAGDREINIELDRITGRTSRLRVNVKQGWFLRDHATAVEIISQTVQTLDQQAVASQRSRPQRSNDYRTGVSLPTRNVSGE